MLKKLRLSTKLIVFFVTIATLCIISIGTTSYILFDSYLRNKLNQELKETSEITCDFISKSINIGIKTHLGAIAQKMYQLVKIEYKRYQKNNLEKEQFYDNVRSIMLDSEFGKVGYTGYIAGINANGILIIHPKSEGVDASKHDFMQLALQMKNGYLEYNWKNPEDTLPRKKSGYIMYFEPMELYIWVSSYKDEFNTIFSITNYTDEILKPKMGGNAIQYVLNKKGDVVVHKTLKDINLMGETSLDGTHYIKEICNQNKGEISYSVKDPLTGNKDDKYCNYQTIEGYDLILVTEVSQTQLFAPVNRLGLIIAMISIVVFILSIILALVLKNHIAKPIMQLSLDAQRMGKGNLQIPISVVATDEVGQLADSIRTMKNSLSGLILSIRDNSGVLSGSSGRLFQLATILSESTETMKNRTTMVASSAEEMSQTVNTIATTSEEMNMNISNVASASEEMSQNVSVISNAIQKIALAVNDITINTTQATEVAKEARNKTNFANHTMSNLGKSANEIGEVTALIKQIAEKTNLLSLNATIEAASAGEAGKGFAVVASEIKELANQSAKAAEKIALKVESVQINSREAIDQISGISAIIERINEIENYISNSISEQRKSLDNMAQNISETNYGIQNIAKSVGELTIGSGELSKNASEAALATHTVAHNIHSINEDILNNYSHSHEIKNSASELSSLSSNLKQSVDKFIV